MVCGARVAWYKRPKTVVVLTNVACDADVRQEHLVDFDTYECEVDHQGQDSELAESTDSAETDGRDEYSSDDQDGDGEDDDTDNDPTQSEDEAAQAGWWPISRCIIS